MINVVYAGAPGKHFSEEGRVDKVNKKDITFYHGGVLIRNRNTGLTSYVPAHRLHSVTGSHEDIRYVHARSKY